MHVRCVGQGDTTVVLIAGFGGDTTGWVDVEPAIAARARVCSYDRPGTGTSDPATSTATFTTAGDRPSRPAEHDRRTRTVRGRRPLLRWRRSGHVRIAVRRRGHRTRPRRRLPHHVARRPLRRPRRRHRGRRDRAGHLHRHFPPTGNSEHLDVVAAFAEAAQIVSLGSLPMAVITATDRELPADLAASEVDTPQRGVEPGSAGLDGAVDRPHAWCRSTTPGHHIEIDQPGVVIDEITRLLP